MSCVYCIRVYKREEERECEAHMMGILPAAKCFMRGRE